VRCDVASLSPFSISVDKNAVYPETFTTSQAERVVPPDCKLRRVKYLNNVIEQDHRFVKKKVRASQCFKHFLEKWLLSATN
jgi:transposase-like protein